MSGVILVDMALAQFDRVIRSDLYGPFLMCRRMVRELDAKGLRGRIVNISSIHEKAPRPGGVDYDTAKGGLSQLTATLALEAAASLPVKSSRLSGREAFFTARLDCRQS